MPLGFPKAHEDKILRFYVDLHNYIELGDRVTINQNELRFPKADGYEFSVSKLIVNDKALEVQLHNHEFNIEHSYYKNPKVLVTDVQKVVPINPLKGV
jgi:hypothetical protein